MRRIDIGVASYGNDVAKLDRALASIRTNSVLDWRCIVMHNPSEGDIDARTYLSRMSDSRFLPVFLPTNGGYAGAINAFFKLYNHAVEYVGYCDNDVEIQTHGWDEKMCDVMDHVEVAQVFPGRGHYGFHNGKYNECLWSAGYCWVMKGAYLRLLNISDIAHVRRSSADFPMDVALGHHEEVDLMIRLRLAGFQIACCPDVDVIHHETATRANAKDHEPGGRIHDGVVRWMNKWNRYFCGGQLQYSMTKYDDHALRYTDWPPCALYLERMTLARFPDWNKNPRVVDVPEAGDMDVVEVLKPTGCYRGRAI